MYLLNLLRAGKAEIELVQDGENIRETTEFRDF